MTTISIQDYSDLANCLCVVLGRISLACLRLERGEREVALADLVVATEQGWRLAAMLKELAGEKTAIKAEDV